jgi:ABC-type multidrug transport system fused ATPase/permease subunit
MIAETISVIKILVKPKKTKFLFLLMVISLSILFESFGFAMIVPLMESLLNSSSESTIGELLSTFFEYLGLQMTVINTSIVFVLIMGIKNILKVFREYLRSEFAYGIKIDSVEKAMLSYSNMHFGEFVKFKHGKLLNNAITETQNCAMGLLQLIEYITGIITVPAFVLLLLLGSFELTLFMFVGAIILYLSVRRFMSRYAKKVGNREITLNQKISSQVSENLSAMRHIRILGMQKVLITKLSSNLQEVKKLLVKWDTFSAITVPTIEFLLVLSVVGYFIFVASYYGQEYFTKLLPVISMMVIVAYKTMAQLSKLLTNKMAVERYLPSMELVSKIIATPTAKYNSGSKNSPIPDCKENDINFSNVIFSYDKKKNHLDNISFTIQGNKNTVLMGPSGSGKSTIIDLLLGLYSPNSGKIEFGDINIRDFDLGLWRKKIGYVGQDVFLFHASIEDNIRMGDLRITSLEVRNITKNAGLDNFIMDLSDGYDTIVGDRGVMLSGGQRQRISIARALVMNPDILILDEATSALDEETASRLNKTIFRIMKGKTVFVVSHKKDVLKYADNIFYINEGVLTKQ